MSNQPDGPFPEDHATSLSSAWEALDMGPAWLVRGPAQQAVPDAEAGRNADASAGPQAVATEGSTSDAIAQAAPVALATDTAVADMDWASLQLAVQDCRACGLCETRRNTVFGVGDTSPRWLIVGEAPGAQEDRQGEPFVGEAGQLLNAMLASVGLSREQGVFILNVLKCRPPGNRDPAPEEVASCRAYLHRQVSLLQPSLILAMGRFAAQAMLGRHESIGALRQQVHQVSIGDTDVPLVVAYHPAYFLRNPREKFKGWQDLCLARSVCAPQASEVS